MEAKATILLDGQEMELVINALTKRSKDKSYVNRQKSKQYQILANKFTDAKEEFHQAHYEIFADKYKLE